MDNCDTKGSHTTVEYRETERVDTSHLSTESLGPEEILKLFSLDLVRMGGDSLKEERIHLERVLLMAVGKTLAKICPDLVDHWEATGNPVALKLGTITPEGAASIHCYACDEDVKDSKLAEHLAVLGIDIAT